MSYTSSSKLDRSSSLSLSIVPSSKRIHVQIWLIKLSFGFKFSSKAWDNINMRLLLLFLTVWQISASAILSTLPYLAVLIVIKTW